MSLFYWLQQCYRTRNVFRHLFPPNTNLSVSHSFNSSYLEVQVICISQIIPNIQFSQGNKEREEICNCLFIYHVYTYKPEPIYIFHCFMISSINNFATITSFKISTLWEVTSKTFLALIQHQMHTETTHIQQHDFSRIAAIMRRNSSKMLLPLRSESSNKCCCRTATNRAEKLRNIYENSAT